MDAFTVAAFGFCFNYLLEHPEHEALFVSLCFAQNHHAPAAIFTPIANSLRENPEERDNFLARYYGAKTGAAVGGGPMDLASESGSEEEDGVREEFPVVYIVSNPRHLRKLKGEGKVCLNEGQFPLALRPDNHRKIMKAFAKGNGIRHSLIPEEVRENLSRGFFDNIRNTFKKGTAFMNDAMAPSSEEGDQEEDEEEIVSMEEEEDLNYIEAGIRENQTLRDFTRAQLHYIMEHPDGYKYFTTTLGLSYQLRYSLLQKIWRMKNPARCALYTARQKLRNETAARAEQHNP